jgi:hypothetical protein
LALPAAGQSQGGDGGEARAVILELSDSTLIERAWQTLFPDSAAPAGDYAILIPAAEGEDGESGASSFVHLLRNGTETGRIERSAWDYLLTLTPASRKRLSVSLEGPEQKEVPLAWKAGKWDGRAILERAEWPYGFAFGVGSYIGAVRSTKPQFQREFGFSWDQRLFSHLLLGASLHRTQFGGGLTRLGQEVADTAGGRLAPLRTPSFWSDGFWWWSASAGVPGLKYTLALASQPLPRYYWLETRGGNAIRTHDRGRLVDQWTDKRMERSGNLSQSLDARFGILRYGILFDFDAYRVPVQTVGCEDLPALFGTWGVGLIMASDLFATRAWFDIPDAALTFAAPKDWPTRVRVAFLRMEFDYRNQRSFSIGLSVRVNIQNPIMNLPGA